MQFLKNVITDTDIDLSCPRTALYALFDTFLWVDRVFDRLMHLNFTVMMSIKTVTVAILNPIVDNVLAIINHKLLLIVSD